MNYKISSAVVSVFLIWLPVRSQNNSETRNFIKTVPVSREATVEIINKYGTIQINQWKKDSAMIRAEIKAIATSQEKLGKMFEGVTINMTESKQLVRSETSFTQNIGMIFESFKGMTSKIITYDTRVEINYYISIPDYVNLKIDNKYGDVYMDDNTGEFSISLSNGSFKANTLGEKSSLTLSFCDATIKSVSSGSINASFSELDATELGDVSINSTSSRYDIKNAGTLTVESRRDKFFIGKITVLKGNSYFSDFNIDLVKKETSLSTRYGNLNIDLVENGFESINLDSGYSDISLNFSSVTSYNLDIRHSNSFVVISAPEVKTEKRVLNEDKKEYITSGTAGKNPGSSRVSIDATRGHIYIK